MTELKFAGVLILVAVIGWGLWDWKETHEQVGELEQANKQLVTDLDTQRKRLQEVREERDQAMLLLADNRATQDAIQSLRRAQDVRIKQLEKKWRDAALPADVNRLFDVSGKPNRDGNNQDGAARGIDGSNAGAKPGA